MPIEEKEKKKVKESAFKSKVAFNTLEQASARDINDPKHMPPQYRLEDLPGDPAAALSYGFDARQPAVDVTQLIDSFSTYPNGGTSRITHNKGPLYAMPVKVKKLPNPPDQGIQKPHEYVLPEMTSSSHPAFRKKSIVDMTYEELAALDTQYRKGVDLNDLRFDGDGYLPHNQVNGKLGPKGKIENSRNIDKYVGNKKKDQGLSSYLSEFYSYSDRVAHQDMNKFVSDSLNSHHKTAIKNENLDENDQQMGLNSILNDFQGDMPTSLRTLMLYVSGRRHTWSAIPWTIKNHLRDGDQIVIIAQIPERIALDPLLFSDYEDEDFADTDGSSLLPAYELVDVKEEFGIAGIQDEVNRMMRYFFNTLQQMNKQDLKISVTVELTIEPKVGKLLKKSLALYEPGLFIISSLVTKYSTRVSNDFRRSYKIPFFVTNKLNIPTVVIPDLFLDEATIQPDSTKVEDDEVNVNVYATAMTDLNNFLDGLDPKENGPAEPLIDKDSARWRHIYDPHDDGDDGQSAANRKDVTFFNRNGEFSMDANLNGGSKSKDNPGNEDVAHAPVDFLGIGTGRIKFSDNLETPKSRSYSSHSGGSGSRRSSNHGASVYKVKSLLADFDDASVSSGSTSVVRSKSYSTPMTKSISNASAGSALTRNNIKKSNSQPSGDNDKKKKQDKPKKYGMGFLSSLLKKKE